DYTTSLFCFPDPSTTEISTLSLHDALPIFLDLLAEAEHLELATLAADGGVAGDQLADAARIHVANARQVEQHLLLPFADEAADGAAQGNVALADGDLSFEVEDRHVPCLALADVQFSHCGKSPWNQV